ncbi:putative restriction endonuclease [Geodermatophilus saharensis]|uniref:Putative restriction endonuclease n=1 Tax=Geodermatophilus saharensis TaxID=1137994 RepID=A0A239EHD7_9ACTN|nr:HNH endonuclease [Geodermatophilus saharensis]SNS43302.1 putative restriction endonuclease [Geodermatophilus saharensis]
MFDSSDYLHLTRPEARDQWASIGARRVPEPGKRQVDFIPVETLTCLAASLVVNHRKYGGNSAHRAEPPVPALAKLFARPNSSILAKMANLDGSRPNGAKHESGVAATLFSELDRLAETYRLILSSAREVGINSGRLPDFLGLEGNDEGIDLLSQGELDSRTIEIEAEQKAAAWATAGNSVSQAVTERLLAASARIGQHRFALGVLQNHGYRCVFCGLRVPTAGGRAARMLTAGHIKPWRSSDNAERLDISNGLAACPTHDVAFDTGLLTVGDDLGIRVLPSLEAAALSEFSIGAAFGRPPLATALRIPPTATSPAMKYLQWHRQRIWQGAKTLA